MKIGDLIRIFLLPHNDLLSEGLILAKSSNDIEFLENGTCRMCYLRVDAKQHRIEVISSTQVIL